MATHNKSLQLLASKLGLADEERVLRKAAEFERLLQTKTIAGSNMTDTSKVVICLDLAAFLLGVELDTKTVIKYSGLKPSMYTNCRKVVENLLEMNSDQLTVPGLCVTLQCAGVQALASNILEEYRRQAKMEIDLNLPQYVCMSIHQACRLNKVKVSKSKLAEKSRLKPGQWTKMEADWTKFVNENFAETVKKRGRPPKSTLVNDETENNEIEKCSKEELTEEPELESYDAWKKRMLEIAYKELRELEEKHEEVKTQEIDKMCADDTMSSRKSSQYISQRKNNESRSPRKNSEAMSSQKNSQLSPRKNSQHLPTRNSLLLSPRKDRCVRLSIRKDSQQISPTKVSQRMSPKKVRLSITKDNQLLSPRKSRLSSSKDSQYLSPRNSKLSSSIDSQHLSPRNDTQHLSSRKDTQYLSSRRDTQLLSPSKDSQHLSTKDAFSPMEVENMSPRRSPRKTPQKFSPYQTPNANKGVRLLFPKHL